MTAVLLVGVVLLVASAAATASDQYASVGDIVAHLSDACLAGTSRSAAYRELRSGQQLIQKQLARLLKQSSAAGDCPDNWSRHENSCYLIPPQTSTWYRAHHYCAALDRRARLGSVHLASTEHIGTLVAATDDAWGVWVGLVRLSTGGPWGWTDGSAVELTPWSPNEPSGDGDCGHIWGPGDPRNGWNDITCSRSLHFLCQITLR